MDGWMDGWMVITVTKPSKLASHACGVHTMQVHFISKLSSAQQIAKSILDLPSQRGALGDNDLPSGRTTEFFGVLGGFISGFPAQALRRRILEPSGAASPNMADEDEEELFRGEKAPQPATTKVNTALVHLRKLLLGCCVLLTLITLLVRPRYQNATHRRSAPS